MFFGLRTIAFITFFGTAFMPLSDVSQQPMPSERQLTTGPLQKDLDNNANFSPDGRFLVFDCRDERGIGGNDRLGKVNVRSGQVTLFYTQPSLRGVGAASFLSAHEVIAIHALLAGAPYDFTVRGGRILPSNGDTASSSAIPGRWLDSRDLTSPFTPGALRGGTHKHEPDASGQWIGFTYNDHIMKAQGSDLRNVGVSRRGKRVPVHKDPGGGNFEGESFSVLLTACVADPKPGSDDYQKADGDCWVGREGYPLPAGGHQRARAFRGLTAVEEDGKVAYYSDVFVVDVPDDLTVPGPLGPLEGTLTDYPKPPQGAHVRRLTRTALAADRAQRGISGWLRATGDGRWIAYIGKAERAGKVEDQLFVVSPTTGASRQLSHLPGGVIGDPRASADSTYVAASASDGSIHTWSLEPKYWGRDVPRTPPNPYLPSAIVISPDSRLIAYNRQVEGIQQIFLTEVRTVLSTIPGNPQPAALPKQPRIVGDWWQVAGDPDLGDLTSPNQQPVDFGMWQAKDRTWQLWSCIRATKERGNTRLFHHWEGAKLTDKDWKPMGIALHADPGVGELEGGLQAPFVFRNGARYEMFYGGWNDICSAESTDGKRFERKLNAEGKVTLFGAKTGNTRDPMVLRIGALWHCYYTAHPENKGAVYCRTSPDLRSWSEERLVARGGEAGDGPYSGECPFVVELARGQFYLFRTQMYGKNAICRVYFSQDPFDFGLDHDEGHLVCSLPCAAPEIIKSRGRYYIAALLPSLKGIQIARLEWGAGP